MRLRDPLRRALGVLLAGLVAMPPAGLLPGARREAATVYDDLGRLRGVVDAAGQWTEYRYDELGNQTHQIDALQRTTRYAYDHLGRRLTRTLPLGQVETMTYNRVGNLETRRDFNGKTTTFQYDELNRLRFRIPDPSFGVTTNAGTPVEFDYWPSGQRKTMSDASGLTSYFYDERDRLQQKVTPQGTLNYGYDDQGNLTGISSGTGSVPAGTLGTALEYRYDDLNRLEYVIDVNTGTTSYVYDDVGNLDTVSTPNAVSHVYRFDALNRLGTLTVANLAGAIVQHTYTKAATGHRTAHGEQWSPLSSAGVPSAPNTPAYTRSVSYGYDNLWRLRRETIATTAAPALNVATGQIDYDLDAVGNRRSRTSSVPGIINQSFAYDANDRLQSDTPDNNGNTLSGTVSATGGGAPTKTLNGTFTYDDRLATAQTTVANAPANVSYVYDGDGNKVSQTINGVTIAYLVDTLNPTGYAQVLEERTNGTLSRTYVWGHALIAQVFQGNGGSLVKTFYAYDGHGNVRLLTDESGAVTDRYHYETFGALIGNEGATANAHLYCGERFDSTIGQYYLRARTMNPLTGRFWTMDTWEGLEESPLANHKFNYGDADPNNNSDPSGEFSLTEITVSTGIVGKQRADEAKNALERWRRAYSINKVSQVYLCIGRGGGSREKAPSIGHAFIWLKSLNGDTGFVWDVNPVGVMTKPPFRGIIEGTLGVKGPIPESVMKRGYKPLIKIPFARLNVGQTAIWGLTASNLAYGPLLKIEYMVGAYPFGPTVSCYSWAVSAALVSLPIQFIPTGF